jgi:hypothetical protein
MLQLNLAGHFGILDMYVHSVITNLEMRAVPLGLDWPALSVIDRDQVGSRKIVTSLPSITFKGCISLSNTNDKIIFANLTYTYIHTLTLIVIFNLAAYHTT